MFIKHFFIITQTLRSRQSARCHFLSERLRDSKAKGVLVSSVQACWALPHPNRTHEETQTQLARRVTSGPAAGSTNTNHPKFIASRLWHPQNLLPPPRAPNVLCRRLSRGLKHTLGLFNKQNILRKTQPKNPSELKDPPKQQQQKKRCLREGVGGPL